MSFPKRASPTRAPPPATEFETGFAPFEPGTLVVSPTEDNVRRVDLVASQIAFIAPRQDSRKRRPASLILPDYAARVTVLDFDALPPKPEEQLALIRFRLKKTLPFDIDSAAVSYFVQPSATRHRSEVVAVSVGFEIIARYEALFRAAAFHPGEITTSALAALHLFRGEGPTVIAKIAGRVLTVMAMVDGSLKLFRCVEMEEASEEDVLRILQPTFAYMDDELKASGARLVLCGFPRGALAAWRSVGNLERQFRHARPLQRRPHRLFARSAKLNMRIPINLASEPFRRDRAMVVASAACAVLLTILLAGLTSLILAERNRASSTRVAVNGLTNEVRTLAAQQAKLDATLRQPANASILERSLLLNTLVERKSVSWTRIFADLELVLPANVRVIQVRLPQINARNEVLLDMVVGAQGPAPVIEFLRNLQASPRFGPATVHNSASPTDNEPLYRYRVSVNYAQKL